MPINDFLPIANNPGADVLTQAEYVVELAPSGRLVDGFPVGIAEQGEFNKVARQSSMMAAALGQMIVDTDGDDLLDDGDLAALVSRLTAAIQTLSSADVWTTGDLKVTYKSVADTGWVLMNDGTIGDATSGADYANVDAQALFLLLWTNISNSWAPVVTGRGGSAAADWAAHKKITLPKTLGRVLAISGSGSGLTARALGQNLGEETHTMLTAEIATHSHGVTDAGHVHGVTDGGHLHSINGMFNGTGAGPSWGTSASSGAVVTGSAATGLTVNSTTTGVTINNAGSGTPFNVMQPTSFVNVEIKL